MPGRAAEVETPPQAAMVAPAAGARVCILMAGHLATSPRMLKAADALAEAGYRVRVVSGRFMPWATGADLDARRYRQWAWREVVYEAGPRRLWTGVRRRVAERLATTLLPTSSAPLWLAARAYARIHPELVAAALAEPADLFYGGSTGALAAVAEVARRTGRPYGLDLEDFHSAEQHDSSQARRAHALARRIEAMVLPAAAFLTTSSAGIADAYRDAYGVEPVIVHNTFPLPAAPPPTALRSAGPFRLYWFSQTVGPGRGLEDAVRAMGRAAIPGELHLRGQPSPGYLESLVNLAAAEAPALAVIHHPPAPPDRMVELCRGYDAGLALEQGRVLNRALCLTNKPLTYILAGLPVIFTDTAGQRHLAQQLAEGACLYPAGDVDALAAALARWANDAAAHARARAAAWRAAAERWHWEHPLERGALLNAVRGAVP